MHRSTLAILLLSISCCFSSYAQQSPTPMMGWSSWNTYRVNISDSLIRRQARALIDTQLRDFGYTYINIDDGFFGHRDSQGRMQGHPQRFPNGLRPVSDYIHSLGLKAGIYSDAGPNTCGSIYDHDSIGVGAGLWGHDEQDAQTFFNDWNFDFIKIDYCGAGPRGLRLDERERYTAICQTIRRVARHDVRINLCRWAFPGTWAAGVASSWRISPDINPSWRGMKRCVDMNLYLSAFAHDGHFNDMDMLEMGRGLTHDEEVSHFGLWCMMSSPLLIGCDLTKIPAETMKILTNRRLIAINQDPLGRQAYVAKRCGEGYVLVKDIQEDRGRQRAVAFYNPSEHEVSFSLDAEEMELQGPCRLQGLVDDQSFRFDGRRLTATLAPHASAFFTMKGKRRLEPMVYEAEWAYLPCFDNLGKTPRPIMAVEDRQRPSQQSRARPVPPHR